MNAIERNLLVKNIPVTYLDKTISFLLCLNILHYIGVYTIKDVNNFVAIHTYI